MPRHPHALRREAGLRCHPAATPQRPMSQLPIAPAVQVPTRDLVLLSTLNHIHEANFTSIYLFSIVGWTVITEKVKQTKNSQFLLILSIQWVWQWIKRHKLHSVVNDEIDASSAQPTRSVSCTSSSGLDRMSWGPANTQLRASCSA